MPPLADLARTWRTARYLRPTQVVARAGFMLERRLAAARPDLLPRRFERQLPALRAALTDSPPLWAWPPAPLDPAARASAERAADLLAGRFTFLEQTRELPDPLDWQPAGSSRLWRFQLHGFRWAPDLAIAARRREAAAYPRLRSLVEQWLARHPVGAGDPWHPFVVAERLLGWLVARDVLRPWLERDPSFAVVWRDALLAHADYLDAHLEHDVGGNHLLKDAVALLVAGCAFDGRPAAHWRERAAAILEREVARQVLADGGHYERSPMYHLHVLEDLLLALTAAGRRDLPLAVPLADAVRRMQRVAAVLVHPDGEIPLFNDAVLGHAPPPSALVGPRKDPAERALPDSGYVLLPVAPSSVLIADCGPPCPDDLPAHAHADALAFEVSVAGRRVLVDGGMATYEPGQLRDHLRGTAAHNTVQVDGRDQSEVYGAFRLGDRARVWVERWQEDADGGALLESAHDGYRARGVVHARSIHAVPGVGWRVVDTLHGEGWHEGVARLRVHPTLRWEADGASLAFRALDADGSEVLRVEPFGVDRADLESGVYAERFNTVRACSVLALRRAGHAPLVFGAWLLLPGATPLVV